MDASKSFLELVNTYEEEVYTNGTIIEWISGELTFCLFVAAHQPFVSDFTQCCLSTPESDDHDLLTTTLGTNAATPRTDATPLLREWAEATMVCELGEDPYGNRPTTEWFCGEFIFYPFSASV